MTGVQTCALPISRKPQGFGGKLMTKMMNIGHAKLSQWGFSNISVNPDAAVLDVGCGGGANIVAWLGKCGNGHVTGMDYSRVSVAESQKLNAAAIKQGKCCVVQGDVYAIPFPDAVFDYVSAFETVYFWPGLKKCFFEDRKSTRLNSSHPSSSRMPSSA